MFRLLHLADIHFDTPFKNQETEVRRRLARSQRDAFARAVSHAIESKAHCVLISGDLFDSKYLSFNTEVFLREQVGRLDDASIHCLYVTGNHDPGGVESRLRRIDWPPSFRIFDSATPEVVDIFDASSRLVGRVVGAGHSSRFEEANLARRFPVAEPGIPYVGLLHTFVTSAVQAESHDRYAPCSIDDLRSKGYSYWALGHIHTRQQVDSILEAWYPGVFHGRHFHETGAMGGLQVSIDAAGRATAEFVPLAAACWETVEIDGLEEVRNLEQLRAVIERNFEETRGRAPSIVTDWYVRFELKGPCPLYTILKNPEELEALNELLQSSLRVLYVEARTHALSRPVRVDDYRNETHIVAEVLRVLSEAEADDDVLVAVEPADLAKQLDGPEARRDYLRDLLEGLDNEAVSRFLKVNDAN